MKASTSMQVRRLNTRTGAALADICPNEREARRSIFWCALYNVGMTKRAATQAANAAVIGEPYALDDYIFTITPAAS
jgi:hypothetical protein